VGPGQRAKGSEAKSFIALMFYRRMLAIAQRFGTMYAGADPTARAQPPGLGTRRKVNPRMFHRKLPFTLLAIGAAVGSTVALSLPASASQASNSQAAGRTPAAATYTLETLPTSMTWFYNQIKNAKTSIDLTMYELQDTTAEDDLGAAAGRGVDVRVILDEKEQSENQSAYNYLTSHGVSVVWSASKYYYTHEKSMVVDGATADIMTLNLQSQYYSTTRDFGVVDTNAKDVSAITKVFNADYAHSSVTPGAGADLVWSPTTAQAKLTGLINNATTSLQVYSEEMDDTTVTSDLVAAAKRGVKVQVVGENEDGEYDSEYTTLHAAGVQISYYSSSTGFYIHGKVIMADYSTSANKIFIGSQNFSNTSLTENRELGLIISNTTIESAVNSDFSKDFAGGTRWT
jgi:phosphatidylserine/phosphatidylglycerophosphate/cardiolipin synthase-like enzyme